MFLDKSKFSIKMKMKINIHVAFHSYKLENREKKYSTLFQKMLIILCKKRLVTLKIC